MGEKRPASPDVLHAASASDEANPAKRARVEESEEKLENAAGGLTINDGAEEEVAEEVESDEAEIEEENDDDEDDEEEDDEDEEEEEEGESEDFDADDALENLATSVDGLSADQLVDMMDSDEVDEDDEDEDEEEEEEESEEDLEGASAESDQELGDFDDEGLTEDHAINVDDPSSPFHSRAVPDLFGIDAEDSGVQFSELDSSIESGDVDEDESIEGEAEEDEEDEEEEEAEFVLEDFEDCSDMTQEKCDQFNKAYGEFMEELADVASKMESGEDPDHEVEDGNLIHALVLGRSQDIRPLPLTKEAFLEQCAVIFIPDDVKELRDKLDEDMDNGNPADVLKASMEVMETLKSEGRFSFLIQYLTVLTDATFDPEYASKVQDSAAADSSAASSSSSSGSPYQALVNKLPEFWNFALEKAKDQGMEQKVLDNLQKFLQQVLKTSVATLGMSKEGFEKVVNDHF